MLPEIVRAAAEPLSNIDTLTVLSNDGASDVVKTVTRTVTEANATVKGLTGIDIPALIDDAMGGTGRTQPGTDEPPNGGPSGRRGSGGGGGAGGPGGRSGGTTREAGGAAASASGPAASSTDSAAAPGPAAARPQDVSGAAPAAPAPAAAAPAATTDAVDAALASADRAIRAASSTPAGLSDTAAGPARPAARRPASGDITRDTTLDDAAYRLASDLRAVPGIERFAEIRLADLQDRGPMPLRAMWRVTRAQLESRYGQLTLRELIERAGGSPNPPA